MFIKKSEHALLLQKAIAYENIRKSIQYSEDFEYGNPAEDANGVVLLPGAISVTHKLSFDPFYVLEQCGIRYINKERVKFEFVQ